MVVELYDGRTGTWRKRDVPFPLQEEVTLSVWTSTPKGNSKRHRYHLGGAWTHTVWRRTSETTYVFVGRAPADTSPEGVRSGLPHFATVPWPAWQLQDPTGAPLRAR